MLLLLLICIFFITIKASSTISPQQKLALNDIFDNLVTTNLNCYQNWDFRVGATDPCVASLGPNKWYGLEFDGACHVIKLTLYRCSLTGILSDSLGNFEKLTLLDLSSNSISGSIPTTLGNLQKLQYLSLQENNFVNSIPTELGLLENILAIDIGYNNLSNNIPEELGNLVELLSLNLRYNTQITGLIPSSFLNLYYIEELIFDGNIGMNGEIDTSFCKLTFLVDFSIVNTSMCYPSCIEISMSNIDNSYRCPGIEDLSLCSLISTTNIFSKMSKKLIFKTASYETNHPYTYLDDSQAAPILVEMPLATSYYITFNSKSYISKNSANNPSSDYLYICSSSNSVTCSNNYIKRYNGNNFQNIIIHETKFYFMLKAEYETDNIYSNVYWGFQFSVTGESKAIGWSCDPHPLNYLLTDVKVANILNVSTSLVNGSTSKINPLKSFATDVCGTNPWTGVTCEYGLITEINLNGMSLAGTINEEFYMLSTLKSIDLSFNDFDGSLPSTVGNYLPELTNLDLSQNNFEGSLPTSFGNFESILELDISQNSFIGVLPITLNKLNKTLLRLYLSYNEFEGKFTNDFCMLSDIDVIEVEDASFDCYESCWKNNHNFEPGDDLNFCMPTSMPSSQPTAPTFEPTFMDTEPPVDVFLAYINLFLVLIIIIIGGFLFYFRKSFMSNPDDIERAKRLKELPVHLAISKSESPEKILELIQSNLDTIHELDFDNMMAFDIALKFDQSYNYVIEKTIDPKVIIPMTKVTSNHVLYSDVILELLKNSFPLNLNNDPYAKLPDPKQHGYAWTSIIQINKYANTVVDNFLKENLKYCSLLANCLDVNGRRVIDLASSDCKIVLLNNLYIFNKYELLTPSFPHHVSKNCIIHIAKNHSGSDFERVALKFMSNKDCFHREVNSRKNGNFESEFVIEIIESFDGSCSEFVNIHLSQRDLFPHCIVLPLCDQSLENMIQSSRSAAKDWSLLRHVSFGLLSSVGHMHSKGYIHGDIQPSNVMRLGRNIKLIDLDSSQKFGSDYYTIKKPTAYCAPEMIEFDSINEIYYKFHNQTTTNALYESDNKSNEDKSLKSMKVSNLYDSWSLGVIIYFHFSGNHLFSQDINGEIDQDEMKQLFLFSDEFKNKKLKKIPDIYARNVVSLLLSKDITKRPTINRLLQHQFFTGKTAARLIGEQADYDVFISYRVRSDSHHAKILYELLTSEGIRVWWDAKCLLPGVSWEDGFADGLIRSKIFVPILSRDAINHATEPRQSFPMLTTDSACDNVLLEYRLALELKERGLVEKIYPLMVGDFNDNEYSNYFGSGCHPNLSKVKDIIVKSVETKVGQHLERQSYGSVILPPSSSEEILNSITINQGYFVQGKKDIAFQGIINDIKKMLS